MCIRDRATRDAVEIEIALQYNDSYSETVFSFANNINTVDGGSHLSGFRTALTRTINAIGQSLGPVSYTHLFAKVTGRVKFTDHGNRGRYASVEPVATE